METGRKCRGGTRQESGRWRGWTGGVADALSRKVGLISGPTPDIAHAKHTDVASRESVRQLVQHLNCKNRTGQRNVKCIGTCMKATSTEISPFVSSNRPGRPMTDQQDTDRCSDELPSPPPPSHPPFSLGTRSASGDRATDLCDVSSHWLVQLTGTRPPNACN